MRISDIDEYRNDLDSVIRNTEGLKELYRRNVLVTGAGGMLGSFIVDVLLRLNDVSGSGIVIYAAGRDTGRADRISTAMMRPTADMWIPCRYVRAIQ